LVDVVTGCTPQEFQYPPVRYPSLDSPQQLLVVYAVEIAPDVTVHHVSLVTTPFQANRFQRIGGAALPPKTVRAGLEIRFKDWLDQKLRRRLHHSIAHRRYPQRSLRTVRLRNVPPQYRLRSIPARPETSLNVQKKSLHASLLDHRHRLSVDAGSPSIVLDLLPCLRQDVTPTDPVVQRMEAPRTTALGGLE
jgi:hypothetical protein